MRQGAKSCDIRATERWYARDPMAGIPPRMLSSVVRPGGDQDKGIAHQICALCREVRPDQPRDSIIFLSMVNLLRKAIAAMKAIHPFSALNELSTELDALLMYLASAEKNRHTPDVVALTLERKAAQMVTLWREISRLFEAEERDLFSDSGSLSPHERFTAERLDELSSKTDILLKRQKKLPASSTTQQWALTTWKYYKHHPEALGYGLERRRVRYNDVWTAVKDKAISEHKIPDFDAFRRAIRAAEKGEERTDPGC